MTFVVDHTLVVAVVEGILRKVEADSHTLVAVDMHRKVELDMVVEDTADMVHHLQEQVASVEQPAVIFEGGKVEVHEQVVVLFQ